MPFVHTNKMSKNCFHEIFYDYVFCEILCHEILALCGINISGCTYHGQRVAFGYEPCLLRDHLQIQRNLVSEKRWSSKGGFMVCTVSASVQGNSGL